LAANRLMVVDDDPSIGAFIDKVARGIGYEVEVHNDGERFLDRFEAFDPTHVVLDLQMPRLDGVELLRRLSQIECRAQLLIASGADGKVVDTARRLGVERGLQIVESVLKPVRAAELRALLLRLKHEEWPTEAALAQALESDQISLHFQPKIDLRTRKAVGYEALVRWDHPTRGRVPTDRFVLLAEQTGLIDRLTDRVVMLGLAQASRWSPGTQHGANGGIEAPPHITINLSARNLRDVSLPDRLAGMCERAGVNPAHVVLEITETSAMADAVKGMDILTRLRLKGFELSIDDFGTGYSSLLQLARLPFSEIKVDRAFVTDCHTSPQSAAIAKSIVDLARNLGLQVVAEGVEGAASLDVIAGLGCDLAQGYYIGRPMPATELGRWSSEWIGRSGAALPAPAPRSAALGSLWTKAYDGSDEQRLALEELLCQRVNPLWNLGRNTLVGWRPASRGIDVLVVPYGEIVSRFAESRRLLHGRRLMGSATFDAAVQLVNGAPVNIPLPFAIGDDIPGAVPTGDVEQVLRRYGITETLHRAVGLYDIVGFSRFPPMLQVAQLNSLECSINTAHNLLHEIGRDVDLARSSTGDGFYVWNRDKGPEADLSTYLVMLLTLADNAMARRADPDGRVPEVRTCFLVGPHYSYHQVERLDPRGHDYIVGDVTIRLARMASKCLSGQILVGDFERPPTAAGDATNPIELVLIASGLFERLAGVSLSGHRMEALRCYLTGARLAADEFAVSRYTIRDKHGYEHRVFNQKFNLRLSGDRSDHLFLGRPTAELVSFEAEADSVTVDRDWVRRRGAS
jgi:EAL domain-containing protein (putative c-di-GMP-specific phosphodiesterase class I)/ActR/RegA family two-component response regulator